MVIIGPIKVYGIIYGLFCKCNGKSYIGATIHKDGIYGRYRYSGNTIIERVYKHHDKARSKNRSYNKDLIRDIEKYGFNNFEAIEIIDVAYSLDELNNKEKKYIALNNSVKHGYNSTSGGSGTKDYTFPPERKIQLSNTLKDYYKSHKHHMLGRKLPPETRDKMRKNHHSLKGKDNKLSEKICLFDKYLNPIKVAYCNNELINYICNNKIFPDITTFSGAKDLIYRLKDSDELYLDNFYFYTLLTDDEFNYYKENEDESIINNFNIEKKIYCLFDKNNKLIKGEYTLNKLCEYILSNNLMPSIKNLNAIENTLRLCLKKNSSYKKNYTIQLIPESMYNNLTKYKLNEIEILKEIKICLFYKKDNLTKEILIEGFNNISELCSFIEEKKLFVTTNTYKSIYSAILKFIDTDILYQDIYLIKSIDISEFNMYEKSKLNLNDLIIDRDMICIFNKSNMLIEGFFYKTTLSKFIFENRLLPNYKNANSIYSLISTYQDSNELLDNRFYIRTINESTYNTMFPNKIPLNDILLEQELFCLFDKNNKLIEGFLTINELAKYIQKNNLFLESQSLKSVKKIINKYNSPNKLYKNMYYITKVTKDKYNKLEKINIYNLENCIDKKVCLLDSDRLLVDVFDNKYKLAESLLKNNIFPTVEHITQARHIVSNLINTGNPYENTFYVSILPTQRIKNLKKSPLSIESLKIEKNIICMFYKNHLIEGFSVRKKLAKFIFSKKIFPEYTNVNSISNMIGHMLDTGKFFKKEYQFKTLKQNEYNLIKNTLTS